MFESCRKRFSWWLDRNCTLHDEGGQEQQKWVQDGGGGQKRVFYDSTDVCFCDDKSRRNVFTWSEWAEVTAMHFQDHSGQKVVPWSQQTEVAEIHFHKDGRLKLQKCVLMTHNGQKLQCTWHTRDRSCSVHDTQGTEVAVYMTHNGQKLQCTWHTMDNSSCSVHDRSCSLHDTQWTEVAVYMTHNGQ